MQCLNEETSFERSWQAAVYDECLSEERGFARNDRWSSISPVSRLQSRPDHRRRWTALRIEASPAVKWIFVSRAISCRGLNSHTGRWLPTGSQHLALDRIVPCQVAFCRCCTRDEATAACVAARWQSAARAFYTDKNNKKLSCRRETARRLLNILLSH